MRILTIALLVFLCGCASNRDVQTVIHPEKPVFTISLTPTRYNILWLHLDNDLVLNLPYNENHKWEVTTDNGSLLMWSAGQIKAKPTKKGQALISCFMLDTNGNKKLYATFQFRVKDIPKPIIFIKDVSDSEMISKEALLKLDKLECRIPNFEYSVEYDIVSFDLEILKGNTLIQKSNKGSEFTDELKDILKTVNSGDRLIFTNITAMRKESRDTESINSKVLLVK